MWYFMSVPRKGKVGGPSTDATTGVYASAITTPVAFAAPTFVAVVSVDVWLLQTELAKHNTRSKAVRRPLMRKQLIRFPVVIVFMWVSFLLVACTPSGPFSSLLRTAAGNESENYC